MISSRSIIRIASLLSLWVSVESLLEIESRSNLIRRTAIPTSFRKGDPSLLISLRGGETASTTTSASSSSKKKKSSSSSKKKKKKKRAGDEKKIIQEAMKEKDAAAALGDAIRERADVLQAEDVVVSETTTTNPLLQKIDQSVSSVGYAMGSSDIMQHQSDQQTTDDMEDGGGVEAAPTSVLANYFLKSHGGAHAVQCVCSLLAVLCTVGAITLSSPHQANLKLMLIKRSMLFAMTKHMSGLLAANILAATAIPQVGLRQARKYVEKLAHDPVSQYVFYAALVLLWLPSSSSKKKVDIISIPWWYQAPWISKLAPLALVGPVLLREAVSTAFVVSDILVLLSTSAGGQEGTPPRILKLSTSFVNAGMSILLTPKVWRSADAATKQAILAKLTSRLSVLFEVFVGLLLIMDGLMAVWEFSFQPVDARPSVFVVSKRLVCARLYLNFLWVRRRKIVKLGASLRGGASQLPFRVIDVLMDPKAAMGLDGTSSNNDKAKDTGTTEATPKTWKDYAVLGLSESA